MTSLTKTLIFEHFAGRTTPLQKKMIAEWLQNADNQEVYFQWLEEYENCFPQIIADHEAAKKAFFNRIQLHQNQAEVATNGEVTEEQTQEPVVFWRKNWFTWLGAATVFMMMSLGIYTQKDNILYKNYHATYGETQMINLTDGSKVTLNANSTLRLKRFGFENGPVREVYLDGEAEFSVTHKANNQRFIVKTSQKLEVEVLGTEFSVFARGRGSKVVLTKGKVKVNYEKDAQKHSIVMKPGELVSLDTKGEASLKKAKNIKAYTAWKSHRFIFDDTSLEEITYQIEENFGVKIKLNSATLANRTITGTFIAEQADDLIAILQELLSLQYEKNNDGTIVLSEISE